MIRFTVFLNGQEIHSLELEPGREYFAGRAEENDIVLGDFPGVSRKHFRISDETGVWTVQVLSKFGELWRLGSKVNAIEMSSSLSFSLGPYEFQIKYGKPASPPKDLMVSPQPDNPFDQTSSSPSSMPSFGGADATQVGLPTMQPFVRIKQDAQSSERQLRLVGNLWTAGRDKNCEIVIDDQHASRRQFSIASTKEGFFITDLGSSNGTLLNNQPLAPNESVPLRSGDVISALSARIYFELHNPDFAKKLATLSQAALSEPIENTASTPYYQAPSFEEDVQPSPFAPQTGFLPPPPPPMPTTAMDRIKNFDWKKHRTYIAIAVVVLLAAISQIPSGTKKAPNTPIKDEAYSKLTPEQKLLVKDSYELAKQLIGHRKWEMALAELQKVHQLVPTYQESKALETETRRAVELRAEEMELEKEQQRQAEMKRQVEQIVEGCRTQMTPNTLPAEVQTCLGPALELDPSNEAAQGILAQAEQNQQEKERREQAKQDYRKSVKTLESLCNRADSLYKGGSLYEARKAFQRCLASPLPDPTSMKATAKRTLASVDENMGKQFKELLTSADQAYQKGDFKTAYAHLANAKKVDPENQEYSTLFQKVDRDATNKMKLIYSDSVLEESLGQIESAKEKWKKIIDMGIPESEYYRRAVRKMQRYGAM